MSEFYGNLAVTTRSFQQNIFFFVFFVFWFLFSSCYQNDTQVMAKQGSVSL